VTIEEIKIILNSGMVSTVQVIIFCLSTCYIKMLFFTAAQAMERTARIFESRVLRRSKEKESGCWKSYVIRGLIPITIHQILRRST
jgi:hypothetical protein